jgi:probable phosphoglycerate mutase
MSGAAVTRVFLVRHGLTVFGGEDRFAGASDPPLAELGREQAQRLGERLAAERLAAVYASPMVRTMDTAALLAAPHALPVIARPELREISHGRWETLTRAEVEARWPDEAAAWDADPYTFAPEGGESGLAVTARALPALLAIVRAHAGAHVAVVSHKATIRLLLSSLLGFDPRRYRDALDQSPAALNIVDFRDAVHARLALFNDTAHCAGAGLGLPAPPGSRLSAWWSGHPPAPGER